MVSDILIGMGIGFILGIAVVLLYEHFRHRPGGTILALLKEKH